MTLDGGDLDAVSFDALGTLVRLEDPTPRLRASLLARLGVDVPLDRCAAAMQAEMRHYRATCHRAADAAGYATVRLECAEILADGLLLDVGGAELLPCLTDAIAFSAYPDAAAVLDRLEDAGLSLAVVSNWDFSLHGTLSAIGLGERFSAVCTSAECGTAKPDPAIFATVLEALDARPHRVLHVGDDPVCDVDGPRSAGLHAVLVQRSGGRPARRPRIATLSELPALLDLDSLEARR